jgi:FkbM family methyltransferase
MTGRLKYFRNSNNNKIYSIIFLIAVANILIFIIWSSYSSQSEYQELFYSNLNLKERQEVSENFDTNIPNRRYVFIDLGANKGDSVSAFLGIDNTGIKFPMLLDQKQIDRVKWDIFIFEANPVFDQTLIHLKKQIESRHNVYLYNSTASWIYDGFIEFYLDTVNKKDNYYGSSLKKDHPDVIKSGKNKVKIPCVDVAKLIKRRNYTKEDFIIVKIDIEGSEYELLLHFIRENILDLIDLMPIEYHSNLASFKTAEQAFNFILKSFGIKLLKWV